MGWAILQDLSGVVETTSGPHSTELDALQLLILRLESDKTDVVDKIAVAKRRRRNLRRRKT